MHRGGRGDRRARGRGRPAHGEAHAGGLRRRGRTPGPAHGSARSRSSISGSGHVAPRGRRGQDSNPRRP
ncbi:hypothetical protein CP972_11170 [Streptomyces prasinus]|uniref:Uncharacterized protein n=1 Tax=Streptomyces prasinus TaxID=67345 RepID=A0ABX6AWK9_9ACTN|nr:hypothetical protein CP972_11170 [Streptomyces prasinus]